jgi:hypothetical protein
MCGEHAEILRVFAKIAESNYQLRHVCLSARTEQLGSQWTDFPQI